MLIHSLFDYYAKVLKRTSTKKNQIIITSDPLLAYFSKKDIIHLYFSIKVKMIRLKNSINSDLTYILLIESLSN